MSDAEFDPERYLDEMARLQGLQIAPAFRPGIVLNLKNAAAIAKPLLAFRLPDDVEAGPVFKP